MSAPHTSNERPFWKVENLMSTRAFIQINTVMKITVIIWKSSPAKWTPPSNKLPSLQLKNLKEIYKHIL